MRTIFAALLVSATTLPGSALAACIYNGVYYDHGAVLCFDGYLQECTVADYWKAIGTCNAADPRPQLTRGAIDELALFALLLPERSAPVFSGPAVADAGSAGGAVRPGG